MRSSRFLLPTLLGLAAGLPAQLAGPYTVGPGGAYPNIAAAIAALTTSGVAGPVTFLVIANDTGPWTIGAFPGQGAANPVSFDALGPVTIGGAQPVLTLGGCSAVTFRGFRGTFAATSNSFVVGAGTTDCVFTGCDFQAPSVTAGTAALFSFAGGSGCRIEDSTFGGAFEALNVAVANSATTVQRCRILGGGQWIMRLGGSDMTLANNFITGTSNYGISGGISNAANGPNLKIWHNAVFINHTGILSQYCSLRWYSAAAGSEVVDNIFVDNYPAATPNGFNLWCAAGLWPTVMNHNCFWRNQPGTFPVFANFTNLTLAAWRALGFDQDSIEADPQFTAPLATPPDLRLQIGSPCATDGALLPLVAEDIFAMPRTAPVSIGAHEEDSGASYRTFGPGCPGTAGIPSNTASTPPRIGFNSAITFGNLPAPYVAIAMLGLSNSLSNFGALPFDLTSLGAPGCFGRVSPDATMFLLGAAGSATLNFATPAAPLFGFTFHTQALVLDPLLNALGASTSTAATAVVGN